MKAEHDWLSSNSASAMIRWWVAANEGRIIGAAIPQLFFARFAAKAERALRLFIAGSARVCPLARAGFVKDDFRAIGLAEEAIESGLGHDAWPSLDLLRMIQSDPLRCLDHMDADHGARQWSSVWEGYRGRAGCRDEHPNWRAELAAIMRDVVGNPWRPLIRQSRFVNNTYDHELAHAAAAFHGEPIDAFVILDSCINEAATQVAMDIYHGRRWVELPYLRDALIDGGCDCQPLLQHLAGFEPCYECEWVVNQETGARVRMAGVRIQHSEDGRHGKHLGREYAGNCIHCKGTGWRRLRGPHIRGCWAVDLCAGKG